MTRYCEFTGDDSKEWDEVPRSVRVCMYAGFAECGLHKQPIPEDSNGWRMCCDECTSPKQIKENSQ